MLCEKLAVQVGIYCFLWANMSFLEATKYKKETLICAGERV